MTAKDGRTDLARLGRVAAAAWLLALSGCSSFSSLKQSLFGGAPATGQAGHVSGFLGGVVADEPQAALVARDVLSRGGNAADAATALGFMLTVTLPSRAGLGGGGACLAYNPKLTGPGLGTPEAIVFPSVAAGGGGDRPAGVPSLARGLYALQSRYGRLPFEGLVTPAEQAARFGIRASRALTRDLQVVAGPLLADPGARAVFAPNGQMVAETGRIIQPDLGATLAQLRTAGVGDLYQGKLASLVAAASAAAGAGIPESALHATMPVATKPTLQAAGNDQVAFLPPPADPENAAATDFAALQAGQAAPPASRVLPASTSFVVADRDGNAVACAFSLNNLFGTGRIAPGLGFLIGASPNGNPPILAAAIAWNTHLNELRAVVSGSGQEGAGLAVATGLQAALQGNSAHSVPPEPGRANSFTCARYLPSHSETCSWAADPREAGVALGGD